MFKVSNFKNGRFERLSVTIIGVSLFVIALFGIFSCSSKQGAVANITHYSVVRQKALDALSKSQSVGEDVLLKAIPSLSSATQYTIGSVFILDKYPLRYTDACEMTANEVGDPVPMGALPKVTGDTTFNTSLGIPELVKKAISKIVDLNISTSIDDRLSFSYESGSVLSTPTVLSLEKKLKSFDCMRDIANKNILVITQVFNLKESYKREVKSSQIEADVKVETVGDIKITYNSKGLLVVEDDSFTPRVWALMAYRFDVNLNENLPYELAIENALSEEAGEDITIVRPSLKDLNIPFDIEAL